MKKFRIGLYGCGNRTRELVRQALADDIAEVMLCHDINPDRASERAAEYAAEACPLDKLLASSKVDMFLISLYPAAHPDALLAALKSGKPVYIEKPVAVTLDDVRKLLPVIGKGYVHVGLLYQYVAVFRQLTELVEGGKIGKLMGITFNWLCTGLDPNSADKTNWRFHPETGGELTQHYCHCFEWFRRLGGDFSTVIASSLQSEGNHTCVEDVWDLIIRQKSGKQIVFHSSAFNPSHTVSGWLEGTNGSLEWEWNDPSRIAYYPFVRRRGPCEIIPVAEKAPDALKTFIERFRKGEPPEIPLEDGLWSVLPSIYARESAKLGRRCDFPVSLDELKL